MQQVPALGGLAVARQLVEARAAPDVGADAPVRLEQLLGGHRSRAGSCREPSRLTVSACLARRCLQQVHALDDLFLGAGLQARHRVVLVEQRDVEVDVLLLLDHALQAVLHDHADFVREGRVVADAVRDRAGQDVAVAVLVLQAFAVERGAARGAAQQEAARLHVARGPGQVADALEAEHRVVDVERHHDAVVRRVRRRRGDPAGHAARLVDAFLQDLAVLVLAVVHHLVLVDRRVVLPRGVVDADLAEQAFHAEGARLVDEDGHHARAELPCRAAARSGSARRPAWSRSRGLRPSGRAPPGRSRAGPAPSSCSSAFGAALRQVAAERLAALVQVLHLRRVRPPA